MHNQCETTMAIVSWEPAVKTMGISGKGLKKQAALVYNGGTYLTLRSVSSLNNPQSNEMKFCEKYEVDMLKIITIIRGYILNNFTTYILIL